MQLNKLEQSSVLIAWFVNMNCYGVTLCGVLVLYATKWLQIYEALFPPITTEKKILVVQRAENAIQQINHYPADKCHRNVPRCPPDRGLSSG